MKTKALLFSLFTVTLLAVGTLITVFFNTAPTTRDIVWLFYVSLFVSCFGLIFLGLFLANYIKDRSTPPWQTTLANFRYATIGAIFIAVMLALRSHEVLNFASGIVIIIGLIMAELVWRRKGALKSWPDTFTL